MSEAGGTFNLQRETTMFSAMWWVMASVNFLVGNPIVASLCVVNAVMWSLGDDD